MLLCNLDFLFRNFCCCCKNAKGAPENICYMITWLLYVSYRVQEVGAEVSGDDSVKNGSRSVVPVSASLENLGIMLHSDLRFVYKFLMYM
jgi:hypothetical protein